MNASRQDRLEKIVEERVTRLETHVEHIFRYLADLKAALERLEASVNEKLDRFDARLTRIIYWALGLYIALAATLLGAMARGFHWL